MATATILELSATRLKKPVPEPYIDNKINSTGIGFDMCKTRLIVYLYELLCYKTT